jgi:hypothetical protein
MLTVLLSAPVGRSTESISMVGRRGHNVWILMPLMMN